MRLRFGRPAARARSAFAALVLLTSPLLASPALAQTGVTLRVTRATAVLENPRGDSLVLGSVPAGTVLTVLRQEGSWYLVEAPTSAPPPAWERGWVNAASVELQGALPRRGAPPRPREPMRIRGFVQTGGGYFTAHDSFETILGGSFRTMHGVGGQVSFPSGAFAQVEVTRFRDTGSRALISGTQVFTLPMPATITVMPIQFTAGYREAVGDRLVPYVGVGLGWHRLTEESLSFEASEGQIGYHVLGGAEIPLLPWLAIAGEAQWSSVPNGLGELGVPAVIGEDDLGGVRFGVKLIVGR